MQSLRSSPTLRLALASLIIFAAIDIFRADGLAEEFAKIKEIEDYQKWSFVRGPFQVSPGMETLCTHPPFVGHPGTIKESEQYKLKETRIRVYANDVAARTITGESKGLFAPGSVILKEKFSGLDVQAPESLGIMIKRIPGFDPQQSDWEFIYLASGKRIARGSQTLHDCYMCHKKQSFGGARTFDSVFVDRYK